MGGEWMIGKFATAHGLILQVFACLFLIVLSGTKAQPQTAPSDQTPAATPTTPAANTQQPASPSAQQPSAQQPTSAQQEEEESVREAMAQRRKAHDYKNWNFNVGAGANVDSGTTKTFVRGGGVGGMFGVARNVNKYFGLRADFIYEDLPLKQSTLALSGAGSATDYLLAVTLDPVINIPVTSHDGGYVLFGPGFFHRAGTLNSDTAVPGSACNSFWTWWIGTCFNSSLPLDNSFTHSSQNEFGYNIGAGITHKMPSGVEVYAEFRLIHGSHNGTTTDTRPITVGVRW
jgi:opacity protein-like surface antigen